MSSVVEPQTKPSSPPTKNQKVEGLVPQIDMIHIECNDLEEESLPTNFSCPVSIPDSLPIVVLVIHTYSNPLEGLVVDDSIPCIHFLEIITPTTMAYYIPLYIPTSIPSFILYNVTVPPSKTTDQNASPV